MSVIRPTSTRFAVPAPVTVTPVVAPVSVRVPRRTPRLTWIARLFTSGSRSASMSLTVIPGMARGVSSKPRWNPGRLFTGASLSST
ncbi:hypothetical protein FQZ97_1125030 [compost metagenome]